MGLQTLLVGLVLDVCRNFFTKLHFALALFLKFLTKDRNKIQRWVYVSVVVGSPVILSLLPAVTLLSAVLSAPLLPIFTLPVFLLSFPRTLRFWPSLTDYGGSHCNCRDSVYYQHDVPLLAQALCNVFSTHLTSGRPGEFYLMRCQDRTVIASVLEHGHCFFSLHLRGLEIEETSCHTIEASKIYDIFSDVYTPNALKFWFNCHPLCSMRPVDSAVIRTYSSSRIVLTGIIDQPQYLERFSGNLLKCIVWVLSHFASERAPGEVLREGGEGESGQEKQRVRWTKRNKVAPVIESGLSEQSGQSDRNDPARAGVAMEPRESDSCSSLESYREGHRQPNSGLIPVDIPLNSGRGSVSTGPIARRDEAIPKGQPLPFPANWLDSPLSPAHLDSLLASFPTEWLCYISSDCPAISGETLSSLAFKKLCLTCFSIVDVPQLSPRAAQTRPHHIYSSFCGEFPYSGNRHWLEQRPALQQLILQAYRQASPVQL